MSATIDVAALLQGLMQQQTALLQAHGESLRIQRLLVEHLLGTGGPPALVSLGDPASGLAQLAQDLTTPVPAAPNVTAVVTEREPSEETPAAATDSTTHTVQQDGGAATTRATPPSPGSAGAADASPGRPSTGTPSRAARYYQAHPSRPVPQISREDLDRLKQLHDVGDAGRLVLQFGPHKGATLAQVARRDPAYIRELALKAQRPEVRVAAAKLVAVLEATEAKPRRRPGSRSTRSGS